MKLTEMLSVIPFYNPSVDIAGLEINKIEMDSRAIQAGDLFVCIKGFTVDGHNYVNQAIANGAVAIIAEEALETVVDVPVIIVTDTMKVLAMIAAKYYQFPTDAFPLIGITGTNGKTTVTYILEAIFKEFKQKTGLIGTIQMKIGDETYPLENTTPDALLLQQTFRKMADQSVEAVMMEVSSHALDLGRVYGCNYDIAIFTNLTQDHLDYHENMTEYFYAKSLLFSQLGNVYNEKKQKFAILNADDAYTEHLSKMTAQFVLTYGIENKADVYAKNIELKVSDTIFTLCTPVGEIKIKSHLIGLFNIYNMLAASATAIARNIPLTVIKAALENIAGVNGRFEAVRAGQDFAVIVDYAHTPDSLKNVLETVREFAEAKTYVVVGCGGDRDKSKRPLMANIALQFADYAILTSDNPRTEDPEEILIDMTRDLAQTNFEVIVDRKVAIEHVIGLAKPGDIIVIAGKGHETYQLVGHTKTHFDDREIARAAILKTGE